MASLLNIDQTQLSKIESGERIIFEDILLLLNNTSEDSNAEEIQTKIYQIGKKHQPVLKFCLV